MNKQNIKKATYQDIERISDFLKIIFPKDDKKYYLSFIKHDPFLLPERIFYIEEDGKIVSVLWSIPRLITMKEGLFIASGIANVGTHPDFRGKGYAGMLMEYVVSRDIKDGFHLAMLVTEIPEFYKKFGFREVGKYYSIVDFRDTKNRAEKLPQVNPPELVVEKEPGISEITSASCNFYRKYDLAVPLRTPGILNAIHIWNSYSSLFTNQNEKAHWLKIKNGVDENLFLYCISRERYLDVLEIVWTEKTNVNSIISALQKLGLLKNKPVRIFAHPSVLKILGLDPIKDRETIMIRLYNTKNLLEETSTTTPESDLASNIEKNIKTSGNLYEKFYLPVTDYF